MGPAPYIFHDIAGHVGNIADNQIKNAGESAQVAQDFAH